MDAPSIEARRVSHRHGVTLGYAVQIGAAERVAYDTALLLRSD
jgi:hypothetical protein